MEYKLTEREKEALILRYGINTDKLKTLDEIGQILIETKASKKIYLMRGESYERRFN